MCKLKTFVQTEDLRTILHLFLSKGGNLIFDKLLDVLILGITLVIFHLKIPFVEWRLSFLLFLEVLFYPSFGTNLPHQQSVNCGSITRLKSIFFYFWFLNDFLLTPDHIFMFCVLLNMVVCPSTSTWNDSPSVLSNRLPLSIRTPLRGEQRLDLFICRR